HVMAGGADDLDSPRSGRVVWARAGKRRQERMVGVDDPVRVGPDESAAQDLHVPGENDEIDAMLSQERELLLLDGVLGVVAPREQAKREAELPGDALEIRVVGDDERHFGGPLAGPAAGENVVEATRILRDEDGHSQDLVGIMKGPVDVLSLSDQRPQAR